MWELQVAMIPCVVHVASHALLCETLDATATALPLLVTWEGSGSGIGSGRGHGCPLTTTCSRLGEANLKCRVRWPDSGLSTRKALPETAAKRRNAAHPLPIGLAPARAASNSMPRQGNRLLLGRLDIWTAQSWCSLNRAYPWALTEEPGTRLTIGSKVNCRSGLKSSCGALQHQTLRGTRHSTSSPTPLATMSMSPLSSE